METLSNSPATVWFIVGVVLILAEFVVPGFIIAFFGLAALLVSLLVKLGVLDTLSSELLVFTVASLVFLFGLRWLVKGWFVGDSKSAIGDEVSDYVGKEAMCLTDFTAEQPNGKVEFKGANWKARSMEPIASGAYGVIEEVDGLCLVIRPKKK